MEMSHLNVTRLDEGFNWSDLVILQWTALAIPFVTCLSAVLVACCCRLKDMQDQIDESGKAVSLVLLTTYKPSFSSKATANRLQQPRRNLHIETLQNAQDDDAPLSMITIGDLKRQRVVDEILASTIDSLKRLRITPSQLFDRASRSGYEADPSQTQGGVVFTRPDGLAPWELIKALAEINVTLTSEDANVLLTEVMWAPTSRRDLIGSPKVAAKGGRVLLAPFEALLRRAERKRPFNIVRLDLFLKSVERPYIKAVYNEEKYSNASDRSRSRLHTVCLESVLLRIFHGFGSISDASTVCRRLDPDMKGFFTQDTIQKALRVSGSESSASNKI